MNVFHLLGQGSSWVISKLIARMIGLHEALLLSDLITKSHYFDKRGELNEDYFFNTMENISEDTTLSKHQIRKAIQTLIDLGLIKVKREGMPARIWYRIENDTIISFMEFCENEAQTSRKEIEIPVVKKFNDWLLRNLTTYNNNKSNNNKDNNNKIKKIKNKKKLVRNKPTKNQSTQQATKEKDFIDYFPKDWKNNTTFKELIEDYIELRKEKRNKLSQISKKRLSNKLKKWGLTKACKALENTLEAGYTGVFEPKPKFNKPSNTYQEEGIEYDENYIIME